MSTLTLEGVKVTEKVRCSVQTVVGLNFGCAHVTLRSRDLMTFPWTSLTSFEGECGGVDLLLLVVLAAFALPELGPEALDQPVDLTAGGGGTLDFAFGCHL